MATAPCASASARHLLLVVACLTTAACSNLRIYSETRDKQGAAALEAWEAVDLSALIATERENLNKLLVAELLTQDQLAAGIRDHELRAMVTGTETLHSSLIQPANKMLRSLLGTTEDIAAAEETLEKIQINIRALRTRQDEFSLFGGQAPECDDLQDAKTPAALEKAFAQLSGNRKSVAENALMELRRACVAKPLDALDAYQAFGGEMRLALNQYQDDVAARQTMKNEMVMQRTEFEAAKTEYEQAVAKAQSNSDARDKVVAAAERMRAAVGELEKAQDALSIELLSKTRLEAIDGFFETIAETKTEDKSSQNTSKASLAFIVLPTLLDDARKALADTKKPLAMPLLIRRNYEELRLEGAKREIAARETMISLSRQLVDAIYDEAHELSLVARLGEDQLKALKNKRFSVAFSEAKEDTRLSLYEAVARYLDVINRLDARRRKLEYMRIAVSHELSLAYAEVNVKQWQSLIGTTVQQAADFSGSGIRAEQIIDLLNAAGVIWIGAGVN